MDRRPEWNDGLTDDEHRFAGLSPFARAIHEAIKRPPPPPLPTHQLEGRTQRVTLGCELVAEPGKAIDPAAFVHWLNTEMEAAGVPARFIMATRRTGQSRERRRRG